MAVGFSLANMNIVVVLPLSILVLREVDYHAERRIVLVGAACAAIGTICLAASKG
jgi:glucose uptake protein GlcU